MCSEIGGLGSERAAGGFEGGGKIGQALPFGVGLKAADGGGGELHRFAELTQRLAARTGAHAAASRDEDVAYSDGGRGDFGLVGEVNLGVGLGGESGEMGALGDGDRAGQSLSEGHFNEGHNGALFRGGSRGGPR